MSATARTRKIEGLGDVAAKATEKLKIDVVVKKIAELFGTDCGCDGRRKKLNRMFPLKR
jgi:hypothetical protein